MLGFYYTPFLIFIELKAGNPRGCFGQRKVKLFAPINVAFASLRASQAFQFYPVIVWTSRPHKSVEFNIMSPSMSMNSLPCISDHVECMDHYYTTNNEYSKVFTPTKRYMQIQKYIAKINLDTYPGDRTNQR